METETKLQQIGAQIEAMREKIETMKALALEMARAAGCEETAQKLIVVHKATADDKKSASG